jgi:hypothetical protein
MYIKGKPQYAQRLKREGMGSVEEHPTARQHSPPPSPKGRTLEAREVAKPSNESDLLHTVPGRRVALVSPLAAGR